MLSPEDKQLICGYMEWNYADISLFNHVHPLDLNDAGLCVEKMAEKGDWREFDIYLFQEGIRLFTANSIRFIPWLFNPDNFFSAMASWLRSKI